MGVVATEAATGGGGGGLWQRGAEGGRGGTAALTGKGVLADTGAGAGVCGYSKATATSATATTGKTTFTLVTRDLTRFLEAARLDYQLDRFEVLPLVLVLVLVLQALVKGHLAFRAV